ncbi:Hypothetical protein NCS54_00345700 [Fusarium falciforme]|uniref:Hypothetical protein n=1 Tax=Fusarium falciforme TaxID=195108 RepID=UPI002301D83D|nr:Hypothetical protein NCS54_00345700 [Fusarium falciforme]WAO86194.1 Hypothetical protein NCS54_00345700 [Fusarium falciforme]
MVKIAAPIFLLTAALASLGEARNCKEGISYCGSTLLNIGKPTQPLPHSPGSMLTAAKQPNDFTRAQNSLFYCEGGKHGNIRYTKLCTGGCKDHGNGKSDTC